MFRVWKKISCSSNYQLVHQYQAHGCVCELWWFLNVSCVLGPMPLLLWTVFSFYYDPVSLSLFPFAYVKLRLRGVQNLPQATEPVKSPSWCCHLHQIKKPCYSHYFTLWPCQGLLWPHWTLTATLGVMQFRDEQAEAQRGQAWSHAPT